MSFPIDRRRWLEIGALGALAGAASSLRAGETTATSFGRAKRCILLFLTGGAPQHDTFDPKPNAPAEIRGEFKPIATSVPGVHFSEMFPKLAARADRITVVRSISHDDTVHTSAGYTMLTGWRHPQANTKTAMDIRPLPSDHPHFGSILSLTRPSAGPPAFVAIPEVIKDAAVNEFPGLDGGFLGEGVGPLLVHGSAETGRFSPPPLALSGDSSAERLIDRGRLLAQLDQRVTHDAQSGRSDTMTAHRARALALLSSSSVGEAFDLERESAAARDRYGAHLFGQGCLMARRLIEAGVSLASVYWHYEGPEDSPVWDTHWNNFPHMRNRLAPPCDLAISALLDDLTDRGLLDDTLVIVMGEFGRTPKIGSLGGRDHWPHVASLLLAGAGTPAGKTYGASDRNGAYPADSLLKPADFMATILHLLGIDPHRQLHDAAGRPYVAVEGTPVSGLVG